MSSSPVTKRRPTAPAADERPADPAADPAELGRLAQEAEEAASALDHQLTELAERRGDLALDSRLGRRGAADELAAADAAIGRLNIERVRHLDTALAARRRARVESVKLAQRTRRNLLVQLDRLDEECRAARLAVEQALRPLVAAVATSVAAEKQAYALAVGELGLRRRWSAKADLAQYIRSELNGALHPHLGDHVRPLHRGRLASDDSRPRQDEILEVVQ